MHPEDRQAFRIVYAILAVIAAAFAFLIYIIATDV
jgi:hypothetical protein